jgi:hypothetical protein
MTYAKQEFNYHEHENNHLHDFLTKRRTRVGLVPNLGYEKQK